MATRNIVPRATGEGSLGTSEKHWGGAEIDSLNGKNATIDSITGTTASIETLTGKTATITKVTATELISRSFAALPVCYMRDSCFKGTKTTLTVPSHLYVNVGNLGFIQESSSTIDISKTAAWDNSTYATAANRKGKDFYIYACQSDTSVPKIVLSANSTVPTGYTASNSRKVGGFHCECADVGKISGHALSGYVAGDILPASVWDLRHRPVSSPEGMVWDGHEWIDIYLASWNGSALVSAYGGVICDGESSKLFHGELFVEEFAKINKHLPSRDAFVAFAKGSNEMTNINGSSDPNTTGGHTDTAGRRMISNIGCEDCCGVLWQWTSNLEGHPNNYYLDTTNQHMQGSPVSTAQTSSAQGDHWLYGYGWQDDGRSTTNVTIDGAMNLYGKSYGVMARALVGGLWGAGSSCGSRSVTLDNLSSNRNGLCAGRGASEPRAAGL